MQLKIEKIARKGILKLISYVPGRSIEEVQKEFGVKRWIKLASNENLLGPSPKAMVAINKELSNIYLYPEGPCTLLRQALAHKFSVPEEQVVISNGADNLILMIANAFVDEGDEVVMANPTFPVYTNATRIMGGRLVQVNLKDFTHDLRGMLRKVTRKTKLVFICNPNNPTGTIVGQKPFDRFLSELPDRVVVVLDEAYCDFVDDPDYPDGLSYIKEGRQLILLRTFSKVYGLAGLRLGYALGRKDLVYCLYQVRDPFPVHRLGQVAGVAALNDRDHIRRSIQLVHDGRRYLYREFEKMGLFYIPSQANFVFVDLRKDSKEVFQALLREGVIVRPGNMYGTPTFTRVTVGRMEDNRTFIRALRKVLKK
jgi:histidinol-phosphate aminotransferase